MRSVVRLCVIVAFGTGCGITYEPDVGPLQAPPPEDAPPAADAPAAFDPCGDSDPAVAISFERDIRPLTTRSPGGCLFCHGTATTSGFNLSSYASLRRGGINSGTRIIVAGKPCDSILPKKLSPTPPYGARMPFNGPPYFNAEELLRVRDWIAEGALDN